MGGISKLGYCKRVCLSAVVLEESFGIYRVIPILRGIGQPIFVFVFFAVTRRCGT